MQRSGQRPEVVAVGDGTLQRKQGLGGARLGVDQTTGHEVGERPHTVQHGDLETLTAHQIDELRREQATSQTQLVEAGRSDRPATLSGL